MHPLQGAVYSRSSSHQERLSKVILFLLIPPLLVRACTGCGVRLCGLAPHSSEVSNASAWVGCPEGPEPTSVLDQPQQWEAEALRTREAGAKEWWVRSRNPLPSRQQGSVGKGHEQRADIEAGSNPALAIC